MQTSTNLCFTPINQTTKVDSFNCGKEELNKFLKDYALLYQERHFSVTTICSDSDNNTIGYYTLSPTSIQRDLLPEKMLKGPRPNPIPGFLLCRLAIDKNFQNKGLGKKLFMHATIKCIDLSEQIGGSLIIIDAKDVKAKDFYEYLGFTSIPSNPLVLVQTIKFVKKQFLAFQENSQKLYSIIH